MSDLPQGWIETELHEVLNGFQTGFASGKKDVEGGLAHLRMNNIGIDGYLNLGLLRTVPRKLAQASHYLTKGDILICTTNSAKLVGKCALFNLEGDFAFSNHLTRLRTNGAIENLFLKHQLWLLWQQGDFENHCKHWVNQATLPKEVLLQTSIALPPLDEQRRIVENLEKLLGKVDACQKRLERIPLILKRFRQSVLAAACSGRLTADWREKYTDQPITTPALQSDYDFPFEIHKTWRLTLLGEATEIRGGIQKTPVRKPVHNKSPYLRVANVYRGRLKLDEIEHFELFEGELDRWKLKRGDILVVEGNGSSKEIGRCAIWNNEIKDCVHQNHIIRCRPKNNIESEFLLAFLNSSYGIDEMMMLSSSTSGLHTLSVSKISRIVIPVAPLAEQQEIVRRVEALFKVADQIEARYNKAKAYVDKLTQSILAKAFRGELVPQDPNDEPASVLLERIRAERAAAEPTSKKNSPISKKKKEASLFDEA